VPGLQKLIGERVSAIPAPNIFFIDKISLQSPTLHDSSDFGDAAILPRCKLSPNLLPLLTKFQIPATFELHGIQALAHVSLHSSVIGITVHTIEAERFPVTAECFAISDRIASLTISDNLFAVFDSVKIMGMNYRDRIWRQIHISDERAETKIRKKHTSPLPKAYLETVDAESTGKHKPTLRSPSFWDLLYAVLQPPLTLESSDPLLAHDLYPYQPLGINFLMQNESALLADEMGTGKTVMTTVALKILVHKVRVRHALIVCPLSVLRVWNQHLEDWAPELKVTFVRGNHSTRSMDWKTPAHVYVTTYDTLRSDIDRGILPADQLDKFDVVVLDEAQNVKNRTSGRTKAIKRLKARQRWALTGTPVENKLEDVVSLFEFLRPGYLTSFDLYGARIKEKIKPYFLRRLKKDVLQELPPIIKQEDWLELDSDQRAAYERIARQAKEELSALGSHVTKMHIMVQLQRLKQICNFAPGKTTSPKLDKLKEQLENIIESNQKVIVFSQYIGEGIDKLSQVLEPYGVARIVGGQTETLRNEEIDKFKKRSDVPILLASVKAGGVGLTLTEASYVIHFDHWWNPAVMWQAEARVHRPGQKGNKDNVVNVYSYWVSDTIEERIYNALKQKGLLFADVVDGLAESQIDELFPIEECLDWFDVEVKKQAQPEARRQEFRHLSLEDIREKLFEMPPVAFENLSKELLRSLGFPTVKVTGQSHDGGVDVIATRSTAGGIYRAVAQCKRYRGTVGVEIARELMGVIAADKGIQKGFLITTGDFSLECLRFCEKVGVIVPIYGLQVANYIKQFGLAI
jgi:hypothetical protein